MKTILGISLAFVMLCGSVPLGFSEPINQQLEQGIEIDQLQCSNDSHLLVQRTNGNLACVTERTAERTGWEIIEIEQNTIEQNTSVFHMGSNPFANYPVKLDFPSTAQLDEHPRVSSQLESSVSTEEMLQAPQTSTAHSRTGLGTGQKRRSPLGETPGVAEKSDLISSCGDGTLTA